MTAMSYWFVPYARRGAAASITGARDDGRASLEQKLTATAQEREGDSRSDSHTQTLTVLGPGDVVGIDPTQVLRTSPRAGDQNTEPNYLAAVEFAHPDLPWLFSPYGPDDTRRLPPWIALVVVEEPSGSPRVQSLPGHPNAVLVASGAELPDPAEAWAWAHVQVVADGRAAVDDALERPAAHDTVVRARLVSPRRLQPSRRYVACVVPTYEDGRVAGLAQPAGSASAAHAEPQGVRTAPRPEDLAWSPADAEVTLPVFHHWRFATGRTGDFESLARRLKPVERELQGKLGRRRVLLDARASGVQPAAASPAFAPVTVNVSTAIAAIDPDPPVALPDELPRRLKQVVDRPVRLREQGARAAVAPPIYGQWHAEAPTVDSTPESPDVGARDDAPWLTELNTRPGPRAVAGVATRVVQQDQEPLMADAWNQLEAVVAANRRARWGQLFQTASVQLHERRLQPRPAPTLLRTTSVALSRVLAAPGTTVAAQIDRTAMPPSTLGAGFVRTARIAARAAGQRAAAAAAASIASPLLTGRAHVGPDRFGAAADRISSQELGALLARAGVGDRVAESSGLTLDDHVALVERLPELVREVDTALRTPVPEPQEEPTGLGKKPGKDGTVVIVNPTWIPDEEPTGLGKKPGKDGTVVKVTKPWSPDEATGIEFNPSWIPKGPPDTGSAIHAAHGLPGGHGTRLSLRGNRASQARQAAQQVLQLADDGQVQLSPEIVSALMEAQSAEADGTVKLSPAAVGAINAGISRGDVVGVGPFDASSGALELSNATSAAIDRLRVAGDVQTTVAAAATRAVELESAALAQFHIDEPIVPETLAEVPEARLRAAVEIVSAMHEQLTPPAERLAPPPVTALDPEALKTRVLELLEPRRQYTRMLETLIRPDRRLTRQRTPSHPIMAAPRFPQPFVDRLARLDREWVLGGISGLPPDSIALLKEDRAFLEAALAGANHEMARELLWRGYPTDQMGTCFARFWPTVAAGPGAAPGDDVQELARWGSGGLGRHSLVATGDRTIVVVRGELLRRYPTTIVSAVYGTIKPPAGPEHPEEWFEPDAGRPPARELFRGTLPPDVTYVALEIAPDDLREPGLDDRTGWFIAFTQPTEEPRFGLDEADGDQASAGDINDLSWQRFAEAGLLVRDHLKADGDEAPAGWPSLPSSSLKWGRGAHGGVVAATLLQLPFQLLLKATDYLPTGS